MVTYVYGGTVQPMSIVYFTMPNTPPFSKIFMEEKFHKSEKNAICLACGTWPTVKTQIREPCAMSLELPPPVRSGVFCFFYDTHAG